MGNYFIFPVPKISYKIDQFPELLHFISQKEDKSPKLLKKSKKRNEKPKIPALYLRSSSRKSTFLMIYFHGSSEDLGNVLPMILYFYEEFEVIQFDIKMS